MGRVRWTRILTLIAGLSLFAYGAIGLAGVSKGTVLQEVVLFIGFAAISIVIYVDFIRPMFDSPNQGSDSFSNAENESQSNIDESAFAAEVAKLEEEVENEMHEEE